MSNGDHQIFTEDRGSWLRWFIGLWLDGWGMPKLTWTKGEYSGWVYYRCACGRVTSASIDHVDARGHLKSTRKHECDSCDREYWITFEGMKGSE